jgi:anti-sigma factor RsiW
MSIPSTGACRTILTNISAYLDGELDTTACDEIERHCQDCPTCSDLVNGLRETVGLCRRAASAPLPEAVRQRARDSVRELLDREAAAKRLPPAK